MAEIVLSVKVTDGSFDSSVSFPLAANREERDGAVGVWLSMLKHAIETIHAPVVELDKEQQDGE